VELALQRYGTIGRDAHSSPADPQLGCQKQARASHSSHTDQQPYRHQCCHATVTNDPIATSAATIQRAIL